MAFNSPLNQPKKKPDQVKKKKIVVLTWDPQYDVGLTNRAVVGGGGDGVIVIAGCHVNSYFSAEKTSIMK